LKLINIYCFRVVYFSIATLFIYIFTAGCTNAKYQNESNSPCVTLSYPLWDTVQLNSVDSNNVLKLIDELNLSNVPNTTPFWNEGISGEVRDQHGSRKMILLHGIAKIDENVYEGPAADSLFLLSEKAMFSAEQLAKIVANSKEVMIKANDANKQVSLTYTDQLVKALKDARLANDKMERLAVAAGELFPNYSVEIGVGDKKIIVHVHNSEHFYVVGPNFFRVYNNAASTWNYCKKALPCADPEPGSLLYLFMAKSIDCKERGDISHRKQHISRLLQKGIPVQSKTVKNPQYHLTFAFEKEKINVIIGKDMFKLNSIVYSMPDVGQMFVEIISVP